MTASLDAQLALSDLRLRVLNREPISADEFRQVMRALRADRDSAARASAAARKIAQKSIGSAKQRSSLNLNLDTLFPGMNATQENDDGASTN